MQIRKRCIVCSCLSSLKNQCHVVLKSLHLAYNSSTCNLWLHLSIISVPITLLRLNTVLILVTFMRPIAVPEPIQVTF